MTTEEQAALTASQVRVEELSAEVVQAWDAYHRQLEISRETVAVRDERTVKWLGEVESRNKAEAEAKKWQSAALEAGKWREVERTAKESAEAALRDLEAVYRKTKAEAKGLREQIIESRTEYAQAQAALDETRKAHAAKEIALLDILPLLGLTTEQSNDLLARKDWPAVLAGEMKAALAKAREEASCYKTAYEAEKAAFADLDAIYRKTESRLAAQAGVVEAFRRLRDGMNGGGWDCEDWCDPKYGHPCNHCSIKHTMDDILASLPPESVTGEQKKPEGGA